MVARDGGALIQARAVSNEAPPAMRSTISF